METPTPEPVATTPRTHTQESTESGGLLRLHLRLGYDGRDFHGWARQPNLRTVAGELEAALGTVLRLHPAPHTVCAGRTDAGVHARDQHVHVDLPVAALPDADAAACQQLGRRLNGVLPADVRVFEVAVAPAGFDARFSAEWREYRYRVTTGVLDPLHRGFVVTWPAPVALPALSAAAELVLGEHDFAAFCRRRAGATTIRTVLACHWAPCGDSAVPPAADTFELAIRADAFCHSMVRSLVGAMLSVGDGRRKLTWLADVLASAQRRSDVAVAPAAGLVLERVAYAADPAARALLTRARRG